MTTFLKAALSYYGIPDTANAAWGVDQSGGLMLVVDIPVHDDNLAKITQRMETMRADAAALQAQASQARPAPPSDQRMRDEYSAMDKVTKSHFGSFTNYKAWRLGEGADPQVPAEATEPVRVADVLPPYVYLAPGECTPQQKAMAVGRDEKGNYAVAVEDLTVEQQKAHLPEVMQAHTQASAARNVATAEELRAQYVARTVAAHDRLNGATEAEHVAQCQAMPRARPASEEAKARVAQVGAARIDRLNGADGKPTSNADDFGGLPG